MHGDAQARARSCCAARSHGSRAEIRLTALAIWRGLIGVYNSDDLTFASSIAYYALLSLFPFFLLAFSIIASVTSNESGPRRSARVRAALFSTPVRLRLRSARRHAACAAACSAFAGSVLMIWAAMGVFGAITSAVNHAWGVEKQPSYFKHKLISFVMLVAAGLLLLLGAPAGQRRQRRRGRLVRDRARARLRRWTCCGASRCAGRARSSSSSSSGLMFYFVPNARVRFRDVWVGAVLTGLLWRGALCGFSWYVRDLSRFSVHGSICGRRRLPDLGLHLRGHPPVRGRSHGGVRAPETASAGGDSGRARSARLTPP